MPGFDRTGPRGQGSMTGGGRGECMTDDPAVVGRFLQRSVAFEPGLGRARGRRRGMGRGLEAGWGVGAGARRGWRR